MPGGRSVSNGLEIWDGLAISGNIKHLEWLKYYHLDTGTVRGNQGQMESVRGEEMGPAGSSKAS